MQFTAKMQLEVLLSMHTWLLYEYTAEILT